MRLLSVRKWLPSVRKWLLREDYLTVTFAKKFTKKKIIFGNQSGPSDVFCANWSILVFWGRTQISRINLIRPQNCVVEFWECFND